MCVSLFYVIRVIDTGSIRPRARIKVTELGVTYLPLTLSVCFFVLCNRHWFNKTPGPDPRGTELEVTYLPFAFSSDASCADLPLPLLGAPVVNIDLNIKPRLKA